MILIIICLILLVSIIFLYAYKSNNCKLNRFLVLLIFFILLLKIIILLYFYHKGFNLCQISKYFYCQRFNFNSKINSNMLKKI